MILARRIFWVFLVCVLVSSGTGNTAQVLPTLLFTIASSKPAFSVGSQIALRFTLKNVSRDRRVLAVREASLHDLIYLDVVDQHGRTISWQGKIASRKYPSDVFVVLQPGQSTTFEAIISDPNGK